jgi:hypothetical protein
MDKWVQRGGILGPLWRLDTPCTTQSLNRYCTLYIGQLGVWSVLWAACSTVVAVTLSLVYNTLEPSQAPITIPVVSDVTNAEPGRTIVNIFIMWTAASSMLSITLFHVKVSLVLYTRSNILDGGLSREGLIQNVATSIHIVSVFLILSAVMVPLARFPSIHVIGVGIGFVGFWCWCLIAHYMTSILCHPTNDGAGNEGLDLDDNHTKTQVRLACLVVMTISGIGFVLSDLISRTMAVHTIEKDVLGYMVLPICEYVYFGSVSVFLVVLSSVYKNARFVICVPQLAYDTCY